VPQLACTNAYYYLVQKELTHSHETVLSFYDEGIENNPFQDALKGLKF